MIDINLIPAALRKDGKGSADGPAINIPKEILIGVGTGLVLLLVSVHLVLGVVWMMGHQRLSLYKSQWERVVPDKNEFDSINKESSDLTKKIKMITDLTVKRSVRWAPKFNAISDALPKGLWIRKMTLDKTGLTIEGSAVSKNRNEINDVGAFISALKQNESFMKDFSSMEVNSIQGTKNHSVDVTDFSVMAKVIGGDSLPGQQDMKKIIEYFNSLNDQARYGLLVFGVILVILLDVLLLVLPQWGSIANINDQIQKFTEDTQQVISEKPRTIFLKKSLRKESGQFSNLSVKVLPIQDVPSILSNISSIANEFGVTIDELVPEKSQQEVLTSVAEGKYYALPVVIKARCGYHKFGYFLNKLESQDMFFILKDFIIQGDEKDPKTHSYALTISLVLFGRA